MNVHRSGRQVNCTARTERKEHGNRVEKITGEVSVTQKSYRFGKKRRKDAEIERTRRRVNENKKSRIERGGIKRENETWRGRRVK